MTLFEIAEKVAFVEMNHPAKFNCLSHALCEQMIKDLDHAYELDCIAVVIKAKVSRNVWSAGHDIRELPTDGNDPLSYDVPMEQLLRKIQNLPIPVIAFVDGTVWGGACDLCLTCDMIVASENATFAITPAKIGIPYNVTGLLHFINQLGINKAREMFFTGNAITAQEAFNVGLLNYIAPNENLHKVLNEKILNKLRANSITSISAMKRQFRVLSGTSATIPADVFEKINFWRQKVYCGSDYKEGINSFLEKRAAKYTGTAKDLD